MYINDIKPIDSKKALLVIDGEPRFRLYKAELKRYHLVKDIDISAELYEDIRYSVIKPRCLNRSMHLLSSRDYTEYKLREKLLRADYPEDIIDIVMDELISYGYIDDFRYAKQFIDYRKDSMSIKTISSKLMLKGISKDVIDLAIDELSSTGIDLLATEKKAAYKDMSKKLKRMKNYEDDAKAESKLISYMLSKGYSYDTVRNLIATMSSER